MHLNFYESHDNLRSARIFGEGTLHHLLINAHSENIKGIESLNERETWREGFEFYDQLSKVILLDVTFRNFQKRGNSPEDIDRAVMFLQFSDKYTPAGITATKDLRFENCDFDCQVYWRSCGELCGEERESHASRVTTAKDYDGSLTGTGVPSIMGSHRNWWNVGDDCVKSPWKFWSCPWTKGREIAYFEILIPGLTEGCDNEISLLAEGESCRTTLSPYDVGYMGQWGRGKKRSIEMPPWPRIAGIDDFADQSPM